ncbi:hypothetical protein [Piscinibacter sp.]|jgi:hypothetical protein|uniref:hypothetical protein n=1 Tax=Piscinibacter sp. TaxID=1903157 RepID=UPI002F415F3A
MTDSELLRVADGGVESSEGWVARPLGPELIEYCSGSAACLVNVGYSPLQRARQIYASESASELFPRLREHLRLAAPLFEGRYIVV